MRVSSALLVCFANMSFKTMIIFDIHCIHIETTRLNLDKVVILTF